MTVRRTHGTVQVSCPDTKRERMYPHGPSAAAYRGSRRIIELKPPSVAVRVDTERVPARFGARVVRYCVHLEPIVAAGQQTVQPSPHDSSARELAESCSWPHI